MLNTQTDNVRSTSSDKRIAGVRFTKIGKLYHFDCSAYAELEVGDYVIVETVRGRQMGQVMGFVVPEAQQEYRQILRLANARDLALRSEWEGRQAEALIVCQERADALGGYQAVKLIAAQYNYDGSSLTFIYTCEDRVDMARLARELNRLLPAQVELRQVGARDVAKLLGGYGACGIERCCSSFLTDFSPVSIKMAKTQGISLNPMEITGMCGRLRCCLVYEYEQYVDARKVLPRKNKMIGTPFGEGKVIEVYPLKDAVAVYIEEVGVKTVPREDIVPLEELKALAKAAKEPCKKHGDGPCDCGKPKGQRRADQPAAGGDDE